MARKSLNKKPSRSQMRKALDCLYLVSASVGAAFILGIGVLITLQVAGRNLGLQVKGADDLTAWSVVAAGFLPLAHTYRRNSHIRVTLLIERFSGNVRRVLELTVLSAALFFVGFLSFSAFDMVWDSLRFKDLSQGLIVIPIWIPQVSIGIGTLILVIAIIDDIVASLLGGEVSYVSSAGSLHEAAPSLLAENSDLRDPRPANASNRNL